MEQLNNLWAMIVALVAFIVWLVRLEGRIYSVSDKCKLMHEANEATQKDVDSIRNKQEMVDSELSKELKSIQVELAQIKGYLMHTGKQKYAPK